MKKQIIELVERLTIFGKLFNRENIEIMGLFMAGFLLLLSSILTGFLRLWFTFYVCIILAMCVDNIFWIPSSPEFKEFLDWTLLEKLRYIIGYRVFLVIIHPLDIIPAIITSRALIWILSIMEII